MSNFVAIVKSLVGQVFAVSLDGLKRQVFEGDRLFQGEQILTALGASASLQLADGEQVQVSENSRWQAGREDAQGDSQASREAVSDLQQAIAAGLDPTTDLEAPAAGPGNGGAGGAPGGGHSFVLLDATAEQLDPTIGFITQGLSFSTEILIEEQGINPELSITSTDGPPSVSIPDTDGALNATDSTLAETAGATAGSFS
ncbi:retention module-containing protein, partial [Pseudomonas sp. SJZ079]|uniref:retention module-containing protein n=1 Tax=Pseudomonas sp. SJZ079 TaxID=2572887 RepID=UPI0011BE1117